MKNSPHHPSINASTGAPNAGAHSAGAQTSAALCGSHIDDSEFFVNPPIKHIPSLNVKTKGRMGAWQSTPTGEELSELMQEYAANNGWETHETAPVVSITQPNPAPTSTQNSVITVADCDAWLQSTYARELAELARWGAHVQARAVTSPHEEINPRTAVLVTIKDGLVGGAAGPDGELTFTFVDLDHPKLEVGNLNMTQFQDMVRRCWKALPYIKDVYQARDSYIAARGGNPAEALPDVEDRAGSVQYQWFTGDKLPKMDETEHQYSQPKLLALVNAYDQKADDGV